MATWRPRICASLIYIYNKKKIEKNLAITRRHWTGIFRFRQVAFNTYKVKGKVHHCTGTEALYRSYDPLGE